MNSSIINEIHKFADNMMRLTGNQPSSMELPAALYNKLADSVMVYRNFENSKSSFQLELYTRSGRILFTKKTCKECGHDI